MYHCFYKSYYCFISIQNGTYSSSRDVHSVNQALGVIITLLVQTNPALQLLKSTTCIQTD